MTRASRYNDANQLVQQVVDELKPHYQALLQRAKKAETDAYSLAYGRAVAQVAKAHRTSEEKAKSLYRNEIEAIMSRVTR